MAGADGCEEANAVRRLRVLVVDDHPDAADSLALLVKLWGHDAAVAYDGNTALLRASAYRPDVVLLDIGLPGQDGYAVAQQLRERADFATTVLVAVTGYSDQAHRDRWQSAFDDYLVKPIATEATHRLLATVAATVPPAGSGCADASSAYLSSARCPRSQ